MWWILSKKLKLKLTNIFRIAHFLFKITHPNKSMRIHDFDDKLTRIECVCIFHAKSKTKWIYSFCYEFSMVQMHWKQNTRDFCTPRPIFLPKQFPHIRNSINLKENSVCIFILDSNRLSFLTWRKTCIHFKLQQKNPTKFLIQ